ncbi:hypothetical protein KS4_27920 [Poriferisphaera corsica]|uniref:Uncharacterized protein n=1 Tax=Poriferisphaera corsica TaxID=2528020 RepID=A0A517YWV7_9BACT|nr:hypothetical protein KS4_27920 [Poriferisphaera corsica]
MPKGLVFILYEIHTLSSQEPFGKCSQWVTAIAGADLVEVSSPRFEALDEDKLIPKTRDYSACTTVTS